jgi:hypothetical protein
MDVEVKRNDSMFHTLSMLCMLTHTVSNEHGSFEKIYNRTNPSKNDQTNAGDLALSSTIEHFKQTQDPQAHKEPKEPTDPQELKLLKEKQAQETNQKRAALWHDIFNLTNSDSMLSSSS